jgi:hypothetical protein
VAEIGVEHKPDQVDRRAPMVRTANPTGAGACRVRCADRPRVVGVAIKAISSAMSAVLCAYANRKRPSAARCCSRIMPQPVR